MSNKVAPHVADIKMPGSSDEPPHLEDRKREEGDRFQQALNICGNGSVISMKNIIKQHAVQPWILEGHIVTMTNQSGMTCLHQAVEFDDIELLKLIKKTLLVDLWKPFMKKVNSLKKTAFQCACVGGSKSMVDIMIESMQTSDIVELISHTDVINLDIFQSVCEKGFEEIENILFQYNDGKILTKLMKKKKKGNKRTAFHWICLHGHHKIVKMITQKVSPNCRDDMMLATDKDGATSLHMACRYNHVETVMQLLLSLSSCKVRIYFAIKNVDGKTAFNLLEIEPMEKIISNICQFFVGEDQLQPGDQLRGEVSSQNKENLKKMPDLWLITALSQSNRFGISSFHDKDQIENNVNILNKYQEVYVHETSTLEACFPDFSYICSEEFRFHDVANLHPLSVLADAGHLELIMHPYIRIYTDALWNRFARYFFYAASLQYLLFFIFISTFITTHTIPKGYATADHNNTVATMHYISNDSRTTMVCRYCSLGIAGVNLIFEFIQMLTKRMSYFYSMENRLDILIGSLTLSLTIGTLATNEYTIWFHILGNATMMLVGAMAFRILTKMPTKLGNMFVMFSSVVHNVVHHILVLSIPIMIFSLAFYNFLSHDAAFNKLNRSIISILSMTIGELNNINIFQSAANTGVLSYIALALFMLLLVVMTISGMNLLIGVAVGDIDYLRNKGQMTSFSSMVDLIWQYSHVLPCFNKIIHRKTLGTVRGHQHKKRGVTSFNDISKFENYCFQLELSYATYYQKPEGKTKKLDLTVRDLLEKIQTGDEGQQTTPSSLES